MKKLSDFHWIRRILGVLPDETPTATRRKRSVPHQITKFYVPQSVVEATHRVISQHGTEGRESYVWWTGYFDSAGHAQILSALFPRMPTSYGRIHLSHNELLAMHNSLRQLDQVLVVELHTHPPGAGGQNEVDAAYPAATYPGFITVVVPDFGLNGIRLEDSYVYEYLSHGQWRQLTRPEVSERFIMEPTFLFVQV